MPKPGEIIIQIDADKLDAVRQFSNENEQPLEDELTALCERIYTKRVPSPVRAFIEKKPVVTSKPRKSALKTTE